MNQSNITKKPFIKQEVFDYVLQFLRKQGQPSKDATLDKCAYRGANGMMCAVGCLIPDSVMDMTYNNVGVHHPGTQEMLAEVYDPSILKDESIEFLAFLQHAHDEYLNQSVEDFNKRMAQLAGRYDLTYTEQS